MMPGDLFILYELENTRKIFSISLIISIDDDSMISLVLFSSRDLMGQAGKLRHDIVRSWPNAELIRPTQGVKL